jgi:hypothetical protein
MRMCPEKCFIHIYLSSGKDRLNKWIECAHIIQKRKIFGQK